MAFDPSTAQPVATDDDAVGLVNWMQANSKGVKAADRQAAAAGIVAAFRSGHAPEAATREVLRSSLKALPQAVKKGIRREWYRSMAAEKRQPTPRLVDEGEFWANNGPAILNGRFTGRGSWRAQAKNWFGGLADHVQRTVGIRNDDPTLGALKGVLNPVKTAPKGK